jgi:hypothetical protein
MGTGFDLCKRRNPPLTGEMSSQCTCCEQAAISVPDVSSKSQMRISAFRMVVRFARRNTLFYD